MLYGILVATAFSDRSADPQRRAAMLAAAHGAETVECLSVVAPAWMRRFAPWIGRLSAAGPLPWQQAMQRLVHRTARLRAAFGIRCTAVVRVGGLAAETMARVDAAAPRLVVLGWHAPSWRARLRNAWAFGTVARHSGRPVLVVRNAVLRPYARVLVPVDFSDAALGTVKAALQCAPDAQFMLLHSLDTGVEGYLRRAGATDDVIERYRRRVRAAACAAFRRFVDRLGPSPASFSLVLTRHRERPALFVHAACARPDLIVLGERHGGFLAGLPGLSAAGDVLADTRCDLLVAAARRPPRPVDAGCGAQAAKPPSISRSAPVTKPASGPAR